MLRDLTAASGHLAVFLFGSLVWMLAIGAGVAVLLFLRDPTLLGNAQAIQDLDGLTMGLTSALQIGGLALLAVLLAGFLSDLPGADGRRAFWSMPASYELRARLSANLALHRPAVSWAVVAVVGGLTVWTFPTQLAAWLSEALQIDSMSLEVTARLLVEGPVLHRLAMALAVVGTAPLFEEVIFRGYLWDLCERAVGRWGALAFTTLLFAGYHLDPIHCISLLPTALFLGALRLVSGSLWPCVLAHLANNGIALVITLAAADIETADALPLPLAVGGTTFTMLAFALGVGWAHFRPAHAAGATP